MRISFSPQRRDGTLALSRQGDTLTINGDAFDFSLLPDGGMIEGDAIPSDWIAGKVRRLDGEIHLTIILPHGANPPHHVAFPHAVTVTQDGPVAVPGEAAEGEITRRGAE